MNRNLINRLIFILAIFGMLVSGYVAFTWLTKSPIVCISGGCETVRKTPAAWPLGIPFPLFGFTGYAVIAILSFMKTLTGSKSIDKILVGMGGFGILLVSYFTYLEAFIIKGFCMWCVISTINMVVISYLTVKNLTISKLNAKR